MDKRIEETLMCQITMLSKVIARMYKDLDYIERILNLKKLKGKKKIYPKGNKI